MRERLRCHSVTVLRARPDEVARLLPAGAAPHVVRGFGLVELSFTRLAAGPARWLPLRHASGSDHLALRVPIAAGGPGARHSLIEESTSSWLRARLGRAPVRPTRAAFALEDEDGRFVLTVREERRELLHLRAEPAAAPEGSVFATTREAAEHLGRDDDAMRALEPLHVLELRAAWLDELDVQLEIDSSFRAVRRRRSPLREPALEASAPALAPEKPAGGYARPLPAPY